MVCLAEKSRQGFAGLNRSFASGDVDVKLRIVSGLQRSLYDDRVGYVFYRARHYDPKLGRFLQPDPIGFAGGDTNLYSYVRNNPLNWTDPLGLAPLTNNSDVPIPFKPEGPNTIEIAEPGQTVDADAVYSPDIASDPIIVKLPDNTSSEVTANGSLVVDTGLIGKILSPFTDRVLPQIIPPNEIDKPHGFPNPYTGRNWPFPPWNLPDDDTDK